MIRSKSTGSTNHPTTNEDIRSLCKQVAPYIVHQWRDVCEELGVPNSDLDDLEANNLCGKTSELAFQGLCRWHEINGRATNKQKLLKVVQQYGLRRAEDEILSFTSQKRIVPYMGRPVTSDGGQEGPVNKQTKQKALADRLARPKSVAFSDQDVKKKSHITTISSGPGVNPLAIQISPSKSTDICEVRLKITLKGVQRVGDTEIQSTKDDYKSTKNDYKHTCHTFVKLVIADQKRHFRELKDLLGFQGISVQRLTKIGFNINLFILCFSLGAFEILYQTYKSGRLKKTVQKSLVTEAYLKTLNAQAIELSVDMDEGLVNKYRDILLVRGSSEDTGSNSCQPLTDLDYFQCESDDDSDLSMDVNQNEQDICNLETWKSKLQEDIDKLVSRCNAFSDCYQDLLVALRIVRPVNSGRISYLHDMITCYHDLRNSKSISLGVRYDLVQEFIAIINLIRLTVKQFEEYELNMSFSDDLSTKSHELFYSVLAEIENMLNPLYKFEADDNRVVNVRALTGMEQEMFGGLLCYLPKLMSQLQKLKPWHTDYHDITPDSNSEEITGISQITETNLKSSTNIDDTISKQMAQISTDVHVTDSGRLETLTEDQQINSVVSSMNYMDSWSVT